jgi:hypothetical protein
MSSVPPPNPLNYAVPQRNDLREIATRQRAIMFCILAYIVLIVVRFVVPPPLVLVIGLAILAVGVTSAVFVFMLAIALYGTGAGIILGILTLIPIVGLIVLLIVNGKATSILRAHGIKVGLLGADPRQIPDTQVGP